MIEKRIKFIQAELTKGCEEMSELSSGDETLALSVKGLESFHEVSESTGVLLIHQLFVQWNEFFKFVGLLTCNGKWTCM